MKVLVISDVHANLTALEAVLNEVKGEAYEAVWCLGDLVGYGPDPNECVERVRALPDLICLIGNHDQAALGQIPLERFNVDARLTADWTRNALTEASIKYLLSLPTHVTTGAFTLAHGSPRQPVWEYILEPQVADSNFAAFKTDFCLVGHSHLPLIFHKASSEARTLPQAVHWDEAMDMEPRLILNPGSVGQPRDLDPRAAFALLDTEKRTWHARRVGYAIAEVQARMMDAGLPERQALRLAAGW